MIEFVVVFLVVLSCTGGLFIVLLFLPKAFPFFLNWVSRLRAFSADWIAEANWKRELSQRFKLDRDRRRREQSHLLWRWDFKGLLVFVCGFPLGWVLMFPFGDWAQGSLKQAAREDPDQSFPIEFGGVELKSLEEAMSLFNFMDGVFLTGVWVVFLSLLGVLFFGVEFCRRYFSAEARYRRIVDREDGLKAERRRRQEGGQVD